MALMSRTAFTKEIGSGVGKRKYTKKKKPLFKGGSLFAGDSSKPTTGKKLIKQTQKGM